MVFSMKITFAIFTTIAIHCRRESVTPTRGEAKECYITQID